MGQQKELLGPLVDTKQIRTEIDTISKYVKEQYGADISCTRGVAVCLKPNTNHSIANLEDILKNMREQEALYELINLFHKYEKTRGANREPEG